jgi:cytochrome c nitrite reductase small subunit
MFLTRLLRWATLPAVLAYMFWALLGTSVGVGSYTFIYAEGASYLSDNPQSCANCHIMNDNFDAWHKSSHKAVATCNDCHAPHDNFIHKYYVKGVNGFNHSWAFTTGHYEDNLSITDFNRKVTEQSCRHCHQDVVHAIEPIVERFKQLSCIRCHGDVGHE